MTPVQQIRFDSQEIADYLSDNNTQQCGDILIELYTAPHLMPKDGSRGFSNYSVISEILNIRKGELAATPRMVATIHKLAMALLELNQTRCGVKMLEHAYTLCEDERYIEGLPVRQELIKIYSTSLTPAKSIPLLVEITEIQDARIREMSSQISDLTNRLGEHIKTKEPTRKRKKR